MNKKICNFSRRSVEVNKNITFIFLFGKLLRNITFTDTPCTIDQ